MAYATAIGIAVITFDKNQKDNPYKIKATKPQPICWNPEDFPKLIVPNTSAQIEMIRRKNGEKVIVVIITPNKPNIRYVFNCTFLFGRRIERVDLDTLIFLADVQNELKKMRGKKRTCVKTGCKILAPATNSMSQ